MEPVWLVHVAGPDARRRWVDSALEAVGNHPRVLNMANHNERSFRKGSEVPWKGEQRFSGSVSEM